MFDGKAFGEEVVAIVRDYVAQATAPLRAQITELQHQLDQRAASELKMEELAASVEMLEGRPDLAEVRREVERAVGTLPPPQDGKSVTLEELAPLVAAEVERAVAALPKPLDGKDGRDGVDGKDGAAGRDGVDGRDGQDGRDGVDGKDGSPGERGADGLNGKDGAAGRDGKDGLSVDVAEVAAMVDAAAARAIEALPKPKDGAPGRDGKDGADGRDGKDGLSVDVAEVAAMVDAAAARAIEALPKPKDGAPGRDGKDGADGRDGRDGADGIGLAGALIDRSGDLVVTFSNGQTANLGQVVGKDGADGRDGAAGTAGRDGFSLDDFDAEIRDGGRTLLLSFAGGEVKHTVELGLDVMIYRGVYKEGAPYGPGDVCTWAGSLWHCDAPTTEKPGEGSKSWTLAVKRGRDGKDGKDGPKGEPGQKGEPGRDGRSFS